MTNEKRLEIEHRIVRKYIKAVLDAGYSVRAIESGGEELHPWSEKMPPNDALFACDDLVIHCRKAEGGSISFIYFVFGNEPGEVVNDYSVSLEEVIAPINQYAEQWA